MTIFEVTSQALGTLPLLPIGKGNPPMPNVTTSQLTFQNTSGFDLFLVNLNGVSNFTYNDDGSVTATAGASYVVHSGDYVQLNKPGGGEIDLSQVMVYVGAAGQTWAVIAT